MTGSVLIFILVINFSSIICDLDCDEEDFEIKIKPRLNKLSQDDPKLIEILKSEYLIRPKENVKKLKMNEGRNYSQFNQDHFVDQIYG